MAREGAITDPLTLAAFKEIADRTDGKAVAAVEVSGPDGMPIESITSETNAIDASRIYMQTLAAGDTFLDAKAEETDDLIDQAARRANGGEDAE